MAFPPFASRSVLLLVGAWALACAGTSALDPERARQAAAGYQVRILRDVWGVPHVFGRRDADTAFGLAWAHAEDDFGTIQEALLAARGRLATLRGRRGAVNDYLVALFGVRESVEAGYPRDLSPATRALVEGYADGLNLYAARHPEAVVARALFPVEGRDVVAGFVQKTPFFYGMEQTLRRLFQGPEDTTAATASLDTPFGPLAPGPRSLGSNTFAVAPSRSADGRTRLLVNSHQPWSGPVSWYEAHLRSEEGWDAAGGVFPGAPLVLHGHNRDLGWAFTVNRPDLIDVYRLELHPDDPDRYRFDGEWRALDVSEVAIEVKLLGPLHWTVKRQVARSVHGPVLRLPHGSFALRFAGAREVRQVEQWHRMNRARSREEWLDAMRLQAIPSFNAGYADRRGNILYLYNARLPRRAEGFEWGGILPGDTSRALWQGRLPFEALPRVENPASGFVQNCNSSPFRTTLGPGNPSPEQFPARLGIETRMTNRALRALELLGADASIDDTEFQAYKFDVSYSDASLVAEIVDGLTRRSQGPELEPARALLRGWDRRTDPESRGAALGVLTTRPALEARRLGTRAPEPRASLEAAVSTLLAHHGRLDPPWREVNRLLRGPLDLGLGGAPDVLHAVDGELVEGRIHADAGDGLVLIVEFGPEGVRSRSIHQYGSATGNPRSRHFADQSPLFVQHRMKPVWMDEAEIRANLESETLLP